MKKWAWIAGIVVVLVVCGVFFGSGFVRNGGAYLEDYSISEDGTEITLELGVASSAGYLRKAAVHQQAGGKLYLDCYAAFGGVNGSTGAQTTYKFRWIRRRRALRCIEIPIATKWFWKKMRRESGSGRMRNHDFSRKSLLNFAGKAVY